MQNPTVVTLGLMLTPRLCHILKLPSVAKQALFTVYMQRANPFLGGSKFFNGKLECSSNLSPLAV